MAAPPVLTVTEPQPGRQPAPPHKPSTMPTQIYAFEFSCSTVRVLDLLSLQAFFEALLLVLIACYRPGMRQAAARRSRRPGGAPARACWLWARLLRIAHPP